MLDNSKNQRNKQQILAESNWYLNELLTVKFPDNWKAILVEDNQFFDKDKIIMGEPEIVLFNSKTAQAIVVQKLPKICFNNTAKTYEENEVRILCVLVAETIQKIIGVRLKKIHGYIAYADYQMIKITIHTNNTVVVKASALKILKEWRIKTVSAYKLSYYMSQNPLMLVSNNPIPEDYDYFS